MSDNSNKEIPLFSVVENIAKITAAIVGIAFVWQIFNSISTYLAQWLILCIWLYFLAFIVKKIPQKIFRIIIFVLVISSIGLLIFFQVRQYMIQTKNEKTVDDFEIKLRTLKWIAYEPVEWDPEIPNNFNINNIRTELDILLKNNFDGLITFSSENKLSEIPRIAREVGFKGVIMGIISIEDYNEIDNAIRASIYVDAFCVSHMFTDYKFGERELLKAIHLLKEETGLPITTSLSPNGYKAFPRLTTAIDWLFPDIHCNWYRMATAKDIFNQTKFYINEVANLQIRYKNKPVLLKMISFPSAEVKNASVEEQYRFFRLLVEYVESSMNFPERVYASYFSGFDLPWKTPESGWPPGERFLGFFDKERKAKIAIIDGKPIKVVDAIIWSRTNRKARRIEKHKEDKEILIGYYIFAVGCFVSVIAGSMLVFKKKRGSRIRKNRDKVTKDALFM